MKICYINATAAIHPDGVIGDDGILHAIEPDYKDIITNANIRRRMSHIVKMGVACGLMCLEQNKETEIDAIITATGLGCLADTEKFLNALIDSNEQLLNPTAFIQSTFNTIGAQIALLTGNHSYNNTFVHRGLSFESALIDSMMRIWEGDKNMLVGAADEATLSANIILKRLGLLQNVTLGEGAQFFLLSANKSENTLAELRAVKTLTGKFSDEELTNKIKQFLCDNSIETSQIDQFITGKNGHKMQDLIYCEIENNLFATAKHSSFKDVCGEYQTASSFGLWTAINSISGNTFIYNHYNNINHSFILLSKC